MTISDNSMSNHSMSNDTQSILESRIKELEEKVKFLEEKVKYCKCNAADMDIEPLDLDIDMDIESFDGSIIMDNRANLNISFEKVKNGDNEVREVPKIGFNDLPHEMKDRIFSYLDADSLINCEVVCWDWFDLVKSGDFWRRLFTRKVKFVSKIAKGCPVPENARLNELRKSPQDDQIKRRKELIAMSKNPEGYCSSYSVFRRMFTHNNDMTEIKEWTEEVFIDAIMSDDAKNMNELLRSPDIEPNRFLDDENENCLSISVPLGLALCLDKMKVTKLLLECSRVDINATNSYTRFTALHSVAGYGNLAAAQLLLKQNAIDVNAKDCKGRTVLYVAVFCKNIPLLKLLLQCTSPDRTSRISEYQLDVNASNDIGFTALHRAVLYSNLEIVKLLCQCETIDINRRNADGLTALEIAMMGDPQNQDIIDYLTSRN